jgi:hypothetical protein
MGDARMTAIIPQAGLLTPSGTARQPGHLALVRLTCPGTAGRTARFACQGCGWAGVHPTVC